MPLASGAKLGPYEIVSALGAGGMGEVYRARDTRLHRIVAIKILPPAFAADPDRLQRFEQEARLLSTLSHPGLLAIFDVGADGDVHYLVSEFLEGRTLREIVNAGGVPARHVVDLAAQLASALAAAHEKGIVHRDLKPENIIVTTDGRAKILDFGLAKEIAPRSHDASTLPHVTSAGMVLGTAGYMAPEQVRGEPADQRSDIFSLGAILYEMRTGQRAFRGDSAVEVMNAIVKDEPPVLPDRPGGMPPGLEPITRRCLEKLPRRRFQSASDLAFAVESLSGASATATATGKTRRLALGVPLLAAIALLAIGAAGWMAWRVHSMRAPVVTYLRLTLQTDTVFNARFAPDGETVVYSSANEGNEPELFVQKRGAPEAQRLGVTDAHLLAVSSKGEIALLTKARYVRHRWFRGTLARMDLQGTAPREMLDDVTDADWSPDGSQLAILHQVGSEQRVELPIGTPIYRTTGHLTDLRFSPRGDRLAFMEHPAGVDDRGVVATIDLHGQKTVLTHEYPGEEGLAWSPAGDEVVYSAASDEPLPRLTIQAVNLAGRGRSVLEAADYLWLYDVSPQGQFLVVEGEEHYEVAARPPGAAAERDVSWLDQSGFGYVSGDGGHVLFTEFTIAPNYGLALRGTDGSSVVRLGDGTACDLSKDGKWALSYIPTSPMDLVLHPTGAGQERRLDRGAIHDYTSARLFRDNQRVLACGRELERSPRCYVQDVTGPPTPVTPDGSSDGLPSPDGTSVVARAADGSFAIYPLPGASGRTIPSLGSADVVVGFTTDGRSVIVVQPFKIPAPVDRVDIETGRHTHLMDLAPANRAGVLFIMNASFADDPSSYVYSFVRFQTRLALVTGAK